VRSNTNSEKGNKKTGLKICCCYVQ